MGKPYSVDLRERVVHAVEEEGQSRREAAARFDVSYSAAIAWVKRYRETGRLAPGQMAAVSRRGLPGRIATGSWCVVGRGTSPCAGWWPSWPCAASRSITARWEFVHAEKLSYKKRP